MKTQVNPVMAVVAVVAVLVGIVLIGLKLMNGSGGGSEGTAVIVMPKNPNDPKYTENLPKNLAGGGFNKGQ
jgi:hypothetical protein